VDVCPDYEDLFRTFNAHKIKYLVVGGYAVIYYTQPRYTKDIDVWVIPELNNAERVHRALKDFGAPVGKISPDDFTDRSMILQIGVPPVRIDIMIDVENVSFLRAWKKRKRGYFGSIPVHYIDFDSLLAVKKKAGRAQDLVDVANMQRTRTVLKRAATTRQKRSRRK
jgi:hypothetical protein